MRWWNGEISGKRCAKNCIDAAFTITVGAAGGLGGGLFGALVGPVGFFAGGIIGGYISSKAAETMVDWLTQKIFSLPKDEATEKAYNYLGVKMSASNDEVNFAFRKLCLEHHPDKEIRTNLMNCNII